MTTPTHGTKAARIHKIAKTLSDMRDSISKEYQAEIVAVFGKKNDKGEIIRPEGEPNGFEPDESRMAEFEQAQSAFGLKVAAMPSIHPVDMDLLSDVKVSGQDLEALGTLYIGNVTEDHTTLDNVQAIR